MAIKWFDLLSGTIVLAVVPFVLAAFGGHVAAQTIANPRIRRNTKLIFWGLCVLGIAVAILYQYRVGQTDQQREYTAARADAERERKIDEAQREALEAQADLRAIEKSNGAQILWLRQRLSKFIASAQSSDQKSSARELEDELAAMSESLKRQIASAQPSIPITPSTTQPARLPTPAKPCRGDGLSECSDEQLLEWGKPLLENVEAIENAHMADLKALDDIKGNWIGFLIGKDKDSKWLKAYAEAQEKAADRFRDCCAENTLKYQKELAQRVGGGLEKNELYDWIQKLLKPINSKVWKEARQEGGSKIVDITGDLNLLRIGLDSKIRMSRIRPASYP